MAETDLNLCAKWRSWRRNKHVEINCVTNWRNKLESFATNLSLVHEIYLPSAIFLKTLKTLRRFEKRLTHVKISITSLSFILLVHLPCLSSFFLLQLTHAWLRAIRINISTKRERVAFWRVQNVQIVANQKSNMWRHLTSPEETKTTTFPP